MVRSCEVAGFTTFTFRVSPKSSKTYLIWFGVLSATFFLPRDSISIPRKVCFFTLLRNRFPNFSPILSAIIELTLLPIYDTLLLSNNHPMLHWFSFVVLFLMQRSHELILNPYSDNVVENSSYHNKNYLSYHILILGLSHTVSFFPFHMLFFLYSGYTSHITSINSLSDFVRKILSPGSYA